MLERFIQYLEGERRFSPLTVENYRRDIERFITWCEAGEDPPLKPFSPAEVDPEIIRSWILYRAQAMKIGAASLNRELSSLRGWFKFLHRNGVIQRDLFRQIHRQRTPKRLPSFVPESRMRKVLENCDEEEQSQEFLLVRNALIVEMFYNCGIRRAELIGINRDDFDPGFRTLKVRGKGNKERMIPILAPLREKILTYLEQIEGQNICTTEEKALFLTQKGARISRTAVYRIVNSELNRAGVQGKRSPHVLRHTFATHLLNHGADMREIQELMGHASLQATQVYTHNSIAQLQKVYATAHPREKSTKR